MPAPPQQFNPNGQRRYLAPGWRGNDYQYRDRDGDEFRPIGSSCWWCGKPLSSGDDIATMVQSKAELERRGRVLMHTRCADGPVQ